jgi:CelD/BcsL family acetyltransferase involved in cellulose biosynthesis
MSAARTASACINAGLEVSLIADRNAFDAHARDWDALVERSDDQIFYRHGFLRLWLDTFASDASLRILVARSADGVLSAALPMLSRTTRIHGFPLREWRAAANDHSCRFDMLADDPATAADAFVGFMRARRDWDLLRLVDVPSNGSAHHLLDAGRRAGLACGTWASQQSPFAVLPASWDAFASGLRPNFRSSLRRRRLRLEAGGQVSVEHCTGGAALHARLTEGFALEAGGWKGRAGSAIAQDAATLAFYRQLAEQAAHNRKLSLWFLRLDGKAIAFDYSLEHRQCLLLLKTAYDERFARFSPGQLLLEHELRDAVSRGMRECDFLGATSTAKLDWTRQSLPHDWLYLFRGVRGRLGHLLKFHVGPSVKRVIPIAQTAPTAAEPGTDHGHGNGN